MRPGISLEETLDRRARRLAKYRKYAAGDKGRLRQWRYDTSPKGIARHQLYEATVRREMRTKGDPYQDCRSVARTTSGPLDAMYQDLATFGVRVAFENKVDPAERARDYSRQIRAERRAGILSPMTFEQLQRGAR